MPELVYNATGQVIDSETRQGIAGLRVEAWDVDMKTQQPLAVADTTESGRFTLHLDFARNGFPTVPDIIFKVFRNGMQLESMESSLSWNANSEEDVTISIVKVPEKRKDVKDRFTAQQFLKWADFVQQSDFKGAFQGLKDKVGTIWSVIPDMAINTLAQMDIKPIKSSRNIEKEVINQDTVSVKEKLESDNITVAVLPYNPRLNKTFIRDLSTLSTNIKPGQKVNLYEENGSVKYYAVVKEPKLAVAATPPAAAPPAPVDNHKAELETLQEELRATKEDSKRKEEQIAKLQQDLSDISKQQAEVQKVFKSTEFKALLKTTGGKTGPEPKPEK